MIIYAVVSSYYNGAWAETEFDLFFTTREKAELRRQALTKKNKLKGTTFLIQEVEVGE